MLTKLKVSSRLLKKKARRLSFAPEKHCRFCSDNQEPEAQLDYKNISLLRGFLTERGKILPSHISGICMKHQRELAIMIKRARIMVLLPYYSPRF